MTAADEFPPSDSTRVCGAAQRHTTKPGYRPAQPRVSVVIPTFNEADNLPFTLSTLAGIDAEIIVVDGRSSDDTVRVAEALHPGVRIVHQERKGKGSALQAGFAAAQGDIIVMLDADGSADGREIPAFLATLATGVDYAKGSRFKEFGGSADITLVRKLGNRVLNGIVNSVFGSKFTDLCYGYNAFWRDCLPYLAVDCEGFEVETLMNIRAVRYGLHVVEVPSYESSRIHGSSNLRAVRDGFRVLRTIVSESRRPLELQQRLAAPPAFPGRSSAATDAGEAFEARADLAPRQRPGLCIVGPGRHAPVYGVLTDHVVHSLRDDWNITGIQLSVPDDPFDWTLIGLNTPSFTEVPGITEVASTRSPMRIRRLRRFFIRHAPSVVMLDWWSIPQTGVLLRAAAAAHYAGAKVALRCCGRLDQAPTVLQRLEIRKLLARADLIITQGYAPPMLSRQGSKIWELPEWKTEERQVDFTRAHVVAFLPGAGLGEGELLLSAFEGLSESRVSYYRLELVTRDNDEAAALRDLVWAHHHAARLAMVTHQLDDRELDRHIARADVAVIFEPDASSRALEAAERRGIPVVVVRANGVEGPGDQYAGGAVAPLHAASVLAAIERAFLARRFRYPDSEQWAKGAERLTHQLVHLIGSV